MDHEADKPVESSSASDGGREARSTEPADPAARRLAAIPNVNVVHEGQQTFGERLADRVAQFGGSWPFIVLFVVFLALWVALNAIVLTRWAKPFDPFPFIFLNLILSMVAALQAPIILMSQNRQAARDRLAATLDYEINLRAEAEIMALHDKLDRMRIEHVEALLREMSERIGDLERGGGFPPTSPPP